MRVVCYVLIPFLFAAVWPTFNNAAIIPHYIMSQFRKTSVQCVTESRGEKKYPAYNKKKEG